jgi:hypothetical protein
LGVRASDEDAALLYTGPVQRGSLLERLRIMAFRAPLLGYNTNVRHKGKLYHIQTEDSGVDHPHVITHLFADGGRIVASKKTSYADRVGSDGLPEQVKKLMQGQHKSMFISLRDGLYDEDASDEAPEPASAQHGAVDLLSGEAALPELKSADRSVELSLSAVAVAPAAPLRRSPAIDSEPPEPVTQVADLERVAPQPAVARAAAAEPKPVEQPALRVPPPPPPAAKVSPAAPRVPELTLDKPERTTTTVKANDGPRSLFGGDLLSDKSLDEVILTYLAANEKDA